MPRSRWSAAATISTRSVTSVPYAEVALSEGEVYDDTIECWLHGSCFDLRTGKPTNPPAMAPVTRIR